MIYHKIVDYTRFFRIKFFRENICQPLLYNMPVPFRPSPYSITCDLHSTLYTVKHNYRDINLRHITRQITQGIWHRSPCKMRKSSIFHSIRPQYSEKIYGMFKSIRLVKNWKYQMFQEYHLCLRVSDSWKIGNIRCSRISIHTLEQRDI